MHHLKSAHGFLIMFDNQSAMMTVELSCRPNSFVMIIPFRSILCDLCHVRQFMIEGRRSMSSLFRMLLMATLPI